MKTPTLGNPQNTIEILQKYNFNFQKKFGQNFLIDEHVLDKIIRAAEITKDDYVLEIGPGIGTMTQYLACAAREVTAVEIDRALIPILEDTLKEYDNVSIINEDILKVDIAALAKEKNGGRPIKVVANLPYYITTPIIMGLFESHVPLESITVMVQKEVADRMQVVFSTQFKTQEEFSNFADVPVEVNATLKYGNSAEDVSALIDGSTSTKLCATGGVTVPLEFTFHYNAPTTASNYYISGANDDEGNPGRTLNSWELYGTNDQTGAWTLLDKQSNQTGWKNYEMRVFPLPEGPGYQHYMLKITKFNSNPGTIQFSGFGLTRSLVDGSFAGTTDAARTEHASMTTTLENDKLVISGHHEGNQSARVYNVLYTGLDIPVTENTRLVYNITPQQPLPNNKYDYDFYSMHLAVASCAR